MHHFLPLSSLTFLLVLDPFTTLDAWTGTVVATTGQVRTVRTEDTKCKSKHARTTKKIERQSPKLENMQLVVLRVACRVSVCTDSLRENKTVLRTSDAAAPPSFSIASSASVRARGAT
jgi:hypothetical protein